MNSDVEIRRLAAECFGTAGTIDDRTVGEGVGEGEGVRTTPSPPSLSPPTPTVLTGTEEDDHDEIELMLAEYKAGRLEPVEVELGPMPPRAGARMNAIAEHMRLLMGLRRALGEDRALPYAVSVAVRYGHAPDPRRASKAIRALVRHGVIRSAGALPPLKQGMTGTKLYAPPDGMSS